MITVSSLLDEEWQRRYKAIAKLNIRSSIYDVTNKCNLRCQGCFFYSSGEHKVAKEEMNLKAWETFVEKEKARGVNMAILIGGIGGIAPEKKSLVAEMGFKSMISGTLACFLTATIAGILL